MQASIVLAQHHAPGFTAFLTGLGKSSHAPSADPRRQDVLDGPYHSVLGDRVVKLKMLAAQEVLLC